MYIYSYEFNSTMDWNISWAIHYIATAEQITLPALISSLWLVLRRIDATSCTDPTITSSYTRRNPSPTHPTPNTPHRAPTVAPPRDAVFGLLTSSLFM